MNRKTWILILIGLALLVLTVDYVFIHVLFPHKKRLFIENLFASPTSQLTTSTLPPGLKSDYLPLQKIGSDNFKTAVADCLSNEGLRSSASPEDLILNLEKKYGLIKRVFNSENIRFKDNQQQEHRLLMTALSTPEGLTKEAHLFSVSPDQIPTPEDLDPALMMNPTPEFLTNLLQDKTIIYDELKEMIYFNSETPLVVTWVNGWPQEFQMVGDHKTLSCLYLQCACL